VFLFDTKEHTTLDFIIVRLALRVITWFIISLDWRTSIVSLVKPDAQKCTELS